jgi:uncharacterized 2Fe-2S/4Fe-4S cluster protein (DUF4445 family)
VTATLELEYKPDAGLGLQRMEAWWNGAILDRPAFQVCAPLVDRAPLPTRQHACLRDRWLDVEYVVACGAARCANTYWGGDILPAFWPNLGPEILTAALGAELVFGETTSWSQPILTEWSDLSHLVLDPENLYVRTILEMTRLGVEVGRGKFVVGLTDLHPGGDLAASLRDPQQLCVDLLEEPERVRQLMEHLRPSFFQFYELQRRILLDAGQTLTTSWLPLFTDGRYYIPSCDFSCMVSPALFQEFFLPEIADEIAWLDRSIYHVDGPNALRHLDALLSIERLNAIQWVWGAGQGPASRWIPLFQQIQRKGKSLHISTDPEDLEPLMEALHPEGVMLSTHAASVDEADAMIARVSRWSGGGQWPVDSGRSGKAAASAPSTDHPRLLLQPIGAKLAAPVGTPLRDLLFEQGVEFPCGGHGRCRGCKVRVLEGDLPVNTASREHLSEREIAEGWRLACQSTLREDLVLELRQWDAAILANDTAFAFTPREGLGVAVDLGTTTLVAQLLDRETGHVLAVRSALNPQARYGADVMSRVQFAVAEGFSAARELENVIRKQIGTLVRQLLAAAEAKEGRESDGSARFERCKGSRRSAPTPDRLQEIVLVGNTAMHHLFCGIDVDPLSRYPFEPVNDGMQSFRAGELGWRLEGDPIVRFLPCLGGFVGSDILAGILATGLHESPERVALVDLGTNGEIVVGDRDALLCTSTAAGPAFEGARISCGMRAATGAIWKVSAAADAMAVEVLGNAAPRGICGSGLVDAVAVGLDLGRIRSSGRLADGGETLSIAPPVCLTQTDIRQLQLAKGAIAAGLCLLLRQLGCAPEDLTRLYLAGAFGNYVDRRSARRIGLLPLPEERIQPCGNTALLGAKMALFSPEGIEAFCATVCDRVRHVPLGADPEFQEAYVEAMNLSCP